MGENRTLSRVLPLPASVGANSVAINSVRINCGGVNQHDWDVVLYWIHPAADAAFQTLSVRAELHRLLAKGANQDVE